MVYYLKVMGKAVRNRSASAHAAALCATYGERGTPRSPNNLKQNDLPNMPVEQFLVSLHFVQSGKLNQLGIKITAN